MNDPIPEHAEIRLADRVVPGGFFVPQPEVPERSGFPVVGEDGNPEFRHVCVYAGGGSNIREPLLSMIDGAREKLFIATLYLSDADVREALLRAVDRLQGGVYVLSALDDKGLDDAINKVDDDTDIDAQTEYRNFQELTRRGIYVRGYPGLHAKFVIADDRLALVSSANLVTRSFHRIGENGVVMSQPAGVRTLARLFGRLWEESPFDIPPSPISYGVDDRSTTSRIQLDTPVGDGPVWTWSNQLSILSTLRDVVESARTELVLATYSIANMTHGTSEQGAQPELLFEPVCRAIERGVRVRMLLRGRNNVRSSRVEATAFADAGVEVYADRLTHAKGVIADGRRGALFSANLETHHGLTGGVEVGIRLDGMPALAAAHRYFAHVMREADLELVRNRRTGVLAARLDPDQRRLYRWRGPSNLAVIAHDRAWQRLHEQDGPVLYERTEQDSVTLYSGRDQWLLAEVAGEPATLTLLDRPKRGRSALDVFDGWLTARQDPPAGTRRGLFPAILHRAR